MYKPRKPRIVNLAQNINAFISDNKLTMDAGRIRKRPDGLMDDSARHWECVIKSSLNPLTTMTVFFSQGSAHTEPPTLADVLDCLASDACGIENSRGFEDWAGDYGYDSDSRKAERIYNECSRQAGELKTLVGGEEFDRLLWKVARN